jgi:hypothetical protein
VDSQVLVPLQVFRKGRRFGKRNSMERWFREMKNETKRFYNNVNSKMLKNIMDSERSSADSRFRKGKEGR